jgi:choline monooxygenase
MLPSLRMTQPGGPVSAADLLKPARIGAINRPAEDAIGLPRQAYTDPGFLVLEREYVFDANWMFVAAAEDITEPGDVMPLELIGRPIVLVRQRDGGVRAFHNVCRHRGVILAGEAASRRPTLTCPYHAWSYGLDGALLKTPHFNGEGRHDTGGFDRGCLHLLASA